MIPGLLFKGSAPSYDIAMRDVSASWHIRLDYLDGDKSYVMDYA